MPFRVGGTELVIILVIVLIIFGAGKLPEVGGAIGKGIRAFKRGQEGLEDRNDAEDEAGDAKSGSQASSKSKSKEEAKT